MSPSLFRDNERNEFELNNESCYIGVKVVGYLIDLIIFILIVILLFSTGSTYFGPETLSPLNSLTWAIFFSQIIYFTFNTWDTCIAFRAPFLMVNISFHILFLYFLFKLLNFSSTTMKDRSLELCYSNWRIDLEYMDYEFNENCHGINALGDNCTSLCCDTSFSEHLTSRFNAVYIITLIILILSIINFSITTLPVFCCQIIKG